MDDVAHPWPYDAPRLTDCRGSDCTPWICYCRVRTAVGPVRALVPVTADMVWAHRAYRRLLLRTLIDLLRRHAAIRWIHWWYAQPDSMEPEAWDRPNVENVHGL